MLHVKFYANIQVRGIRVIKVLICVNLHMAYKAQLGYKAKLGFEVLYLK